MSLDIGSIRSVQEKEIEIIHPVSKVPIGAFVTLASYEHQNRRIARIEIARQLRERGESGGVDGNSSLIDEIAAESVARSILGWRGIRSSGKDLEFSLDAAIALLKEPSMYWLLQQLLDALGRQENFIETSASA